MLLTTSRFGIDVSTREVFVLSGSRRTCLSLPGEGLSDTKSDKEALCILLRVQKEISQDREEGTVSRGYRWTLKQRGTGKCDIWILHPPKYLFTQTAAEHVRGLPH
jgi:hypothetical protein